MSTRIDKKVWRFYRRQDAVVEAARAWFANKNLDKDDTWDHADDDLYDAVEDYEASLMEVRDQ
jgi:hypothetical protein